MQEGEGPLLQSSERKFKRQQKGDTNCTALLSLIYLMQVLITHKNELLWLLLAAAKTQAYTCGVTYKELPLWQKYRQAYRRKRRQHKLLKDGTNLCIWIELLGVGLIQPRNC